RDGTAAVANGRDGILLGVGATNNTVGGTTAAARNLISGNAVNGVEINASTATNNVVEGNYIGTNAAGAAALGNAGAGVLIQGGATGNTVGGTTPGAGNLVSANGTFGIDVRDTGTSGNLVAGNFIGTDVTGTAKLGNDSSGAKGGGGVVIEL